MQMFTIYTSLKFCCLVKSYLSILIPFPHYQTFNDPVGQLFENIVGKGENAGNQHFPLFPQCFIPFPEQI